MQREVCASLLVSSRYSIGKKDRRVLSKSPVVEKIHSVTPGFTTGQTSRRLPQLYTPVPRNHVRRPKKIVPPPQNHPIARFTGSDGTPHDARIGQLWFAAVKIATMLLIKVIQVEQYLPQVATV